MLVNNRLYGKAHTYNVEGGVFIYNSNVVDVVSAIAMGFSEILIISTTNDFVWFLLSAQEFIFLSCREDDEEALVRFR